MSLKRKLIFSLIFLLTLAAIFTLTISARRTEVVGGTISPKTLNSGKDTDSSSPGIVQNDKQLFPVVRVVDGDTVVISKDGAKEKIRLIGIDSPEVVDPRRPIQCYGEEASAYMEALLGGRSVSLKYDPTQARIDKYGRTLAYLYRDDGLLINEAMVANGYAYEYTYDNDYTLKSIIFSAEQDAKSRSLGLWSKETCDGKR